MDRIKIIWVKLFKTLPLTFSKINYYWPNIIFIISFFNHSNQGTPINCFLLYGTNEINLKIKNINLSIWCSAYAKICVATFMWRKILQWNKYIAIKPFAINYHKGVSINFHATPTEQSVHVCKFPSPHNSSPRTLYEMLNKINNFNQQYTKILFY